jgi:hypothetical protein
MKMKENYKETMLAQGFSDKQIDLNDLDIVDEVEEELIQGFLVQKCENSGEKYLSKGPIFRGKDSRYRPYDHATASNDLKTVQGHFMDDGEEKRGILAIFEDEKLTTDVESGIPTLPNTTNSSNSSSGKNHVIYKSSENVYNRVEITTFISLCDELQKFVINLPKLVSFTSIRVPERQKK